MRRANETIYYVRDMDASVAYWTETVGMALIKRYPWGFSLLDSDGDGGRVGLMDLALYDGDLQQGTVPPPRLSMNVVSVKEEVQQILGRGGKATNVVSSEDGMSSATVFDPDGNAVFFWDDGSGQLAGE